MANCGFKNALIGLKDKDPSWPQLHDSCQKKKRKSPKASLRSGEDSSCSYLQIISSNQSETNPGTVKLSTDEFPALSNVPCKLKPIFPTQRKKSEHCLGNISKCGSKLKHSKLKNSVINVPILSLVKVKCRRKKFLLKRPEVKREILCGNKLDGNTPLRRKGKFRLHKKKPESRLKKEIIISKQIKKKTQYFNPQILKIKSLIPSIVSSLSHVSIDDLGCLMSSIKLDDKSDVLSESDVNNENGKELTNESIHGEVEIKNLAKNILHSNSFKGYCTNMVTPQLLKVTEDLITTLRAFQDRLHAKDPGKAFAKRRYVCGFKETKKFLLADRVKLVFVATDLQLEEDLPSGRILIEIKTSCSDKGVPLIYVGRGNQIGFWTLKRRRISVVGIMNYEGADKICRELLEHWQSCKELYNKILNQIELILTAKTPIDKSDVKPIEEEIRGKILSKLLLEEIESFPGKTD